MRLREQIEQRWFPWIVVGVLAVAAVPVGFMAWWATLIEYRNHPPSCYGIGWGCTLSPTDVGGLVGGLWLFGVAGVAVLLAISELFWERVAAARSVMTLTAGLAGLAGAIFIFQWGTG